MAAGSKRKRKPARDRMTEMVHVPMSPEHYQKLEQMLATDRRSKTEFMRMLLEDEWERRQKAATTAAQGNGAAA